MGLVCKSGVLTLRFYCERAPSSLQAHGIPANLAAILKTYDINRPPASVSVKQLYDRIIGKVSTVTPLKTRLEVPLASNPGSVRGEKESRPGTHCMRMRQKAPDLFFRKRPHTFVVDLP